MTWCCLFSCCDDKEVKPPVVTPVNTPSSISNMPLMTDRHDSFESWDLDKTPKPK